MVDKSIRKRLLSLAIGELAASLTFVLALISLHVNMGLRVNLIILYPFGLLIFVLLQGSYYWFYRLRVLRNAELDRDQFRSNYKALRLFDIALFLLYPVLLVFMFRTHRAAFTTGSTLLGLFLYVFGIAEFINYFYIRLSYSRFDDIASLLKLKNLKRSSLNRELDRYDTSY